MDDFFDDGVIFSHMSYSPRPPTDEQIQHSIRKTKYARVFHKLVQLLAKGLPGEQKGPVPVEKNVLCFGCEEHVNEVHYQFKICYECCCMFALVEEMDWYGKKERQDLLEHAASELHRRICRDKDIDLICAQAECNRETAFKAFHETGDFVAAIMHVLES